ncbi:hypothetical protein N7450_011329 [Penicillium hetheringtonii]|uniref:DUF7136 domain-containing protein n=1 Tax=Penicillium hetheringtonii TaxID=911720 RepID=A0AAD6D9Z5_9EURO|nr:hypothetical protein N7450_011329 [Penicillium hetheringtonii]
MVSMGMAETTGLGFAEIDLVFPRDGIFDLMPLAPVIFVIQNHTPVDIPQRHQSLNRTLVEQHLPNATATTGSVQFLAARISNTLNTENNWGFAWKVNWTNCSTSANKTSSDSELKINLGKEWDGQSRAEGGSNPGDLSTTNEHH